MPHPVGRRPWLGRVQRRSRARLRRLQLVGEHIVVAALAVMQEAAAPRPENRKPPPYPRAHFGGQTFSGRGPSAALLHFGSAVPPSTPRDNRASRRESFSGWAPDERWYCLLSGASCWVSSERSRSKSARLASISRGSTSSCRRSKVRGRRPDSGSPEAEILNSGLSPLKLIAFSQRAVRGAQLAAASPTTFCRSRWLPSR